jgi:hypothetical protein
MPRQLSLPHCAFACSGLAALLASAEPLRAQSTGPTATRRLSAPEAVFAESFTQITGVRELRDGRVLVSDSRDRTLQVVDLRTGDARSVGREGSGPGEWGQPARLHEMPGDSTLMVDFSNGRFFVILPTGAPGPTFRVDAGSLVVTGTLLGVDAQGRLIYERERFPTDQGPMSASTGVADILRYDRASQRTDTVAQLATVRGERSGARALPGGFVQTYTNLPFAARDLAVVAPNGRIGIVRSAGYFVEWIGDDGKRVTGPRGPASRIRITQEEKDAFVRGQVRPGRITVSGGGASPGGGGAVARQYTGDLSALVNPDMRWPDEKPPFLTNAARAAPDGRIWVLRTRAHDDPVPSYDVFDATGRVVERVVLPENARLVGFGRGVIYLARSDEDDLQHLERHRVP